MIIGWRETRECAFHAVIPPCRNPCLGKRKCVEAGNPSCYIVASTTVSCMKYCYWLSDKTEAHSTPQLRKSSSPTLVNHIDEPSILRWCGAWGWTKCHLLGQHRHTKSIGIICKTREKRCWGTVLNGPDLLHVTHHCSFASYFFPSLLID